MEGVEEGSGGAHLLWVRGLGKEISKRTSSLNVLFAVFLELNNSFIRKMYSQIDYYFLISVNELPLKKAGLLRQGPHYHNQVLNKM